MGYSIGTDTTGYAIGTLAKIASAFAKLESGDFYYVKRALAGFCDTAVIDFARTLTVSTKFWRGDDWCWTREKALSKICGSVHERKIIAFGAELEADRLVEKLKPMMSSGAKYLKGAA